MNEANLRARIKRIQNGSGVNRDMLPESMRGLMAKDLWDVPEFACGMEYGYLLAMKDLLSGVDSTNSCKRCHSIGKIVECGGYELYERVPCPDCQGGLKVTEDCDT